MLGYFFNSRMYSQFKFYFIKIIKLTFFLVVNYQENHSSDITYISSSCKLNNKDLKISLKQLDICNLIWKKMSLFFLRGVFHQYYESKEKNISNVNEQFLSKENTNENLLMSLLKKNNKRFVIIFFF